MSPRLGDDDGLLLLLLPGDEDGLTQCSVKQKRISLAEQGLCCEEDGSDGGVGAEARCLVKSLLAD